MRKIWAVAVCLVTAACAGATTSSPATRSTPPIPTGAATCDPINLVGPDGASVDLSGQWISDPQWFSTPTAGEQTFALQIGECVWMSVTDAAYRAEPEQGASTLAQFNGRLISDFTLTGTLVTVLRQQEPLGGFVYRGDVFPVEFEIHFDEAGSPYIEEVIDEDSLRCHLGLGNAQVQCPEPTVLHRPSEQPPPP